jgi:4-diphosphocytidyl-2-C-methyl-D-erythritol kinase
MDKLTIEARAKVNLSLDVLGKMDDGYHEILTVMQTLSLHDDVELTVKKGSGAVTAKSNRYYLPRDERNIAGRAARLFLTEAGIADRDVSIYIKKRNPVCAGLGGGSTDGGAVLVGLNRMFGTGFTAEDMRKMGEKLGSDVPFTIEGGTALAGGRGEKLTQLKPLPKCRIVVCKPEFSVSTPALYNAIDNRKIKLRPNTEGMLNALENGDLNGVAKRLFNVFEEPVSEEHSDILRIKDALYDYGALGASMSGTGSAVFGIFDDADGAERAYKALKALYKESFLTESV